MLSLFISGKEKSRLVRATSMHRSPRGAYRWNIRPPTFVQLKSASAQD
jgi:hypothetical protein